MIFLTPLIVKYMERDLDITKPRYSKQILPVPKPFVTSGSTVQGNVWMSLENLYVELKG